MKFWTWKILILCLKDNLLQPQKNNTVITLDSSNSQKEKQERKREREREYLWTCLKKLTEEDWFRSEWSLGSEKILIFIVVGIFPFFYPVTPRNFYDLFYNFGKQNHPLFPFLFLLCTYLKW